MPDITIPDAAVEAAAIAQYAEDTNASMSPDYWPEWESDDNNARDLYREEARIALAAAAPLIAAQALRDAADQWQINGWAESLPLAGNPVIAMAQHGTDWLRARADRIEADHG